MPTRPARRERRRAERRSQKVSSSLQSAAPSTYDPTYTVMPPFPTPDVTLAAHPSIRPIMLLVLSQEDLVRDQIGAFRMLASIESYRSHPKAEYRMEELRRIAWAHHAHVQKLQALKRRYAEQVTMWGFECSKSREDWNTAFIERRKLHVVQLNREVKKMTLVFEKQLEEVLKNEDLFDGEEHRQVFMDKLNLYRDLFDKTLKETEGMSG
ncbi:hypothetical protein P153DRAFT_386953 [Dothidotthia symphoricarpi CBS 119687]|uniref:Uncharacterized protein n=1 Tax=Dothidotthia symphoricarpi CBS 119687 TaxID=1392245 RepID=A0A6A6AAU0_9PLEO|nr:uncharacterized protein P153DRAFT_386953 [Dothidotthia symphoricarpi CBS 119687]KAF2127977.1 hypothetical protein P153DRAFT_386953 [Dothidotthia symphoricarpi CBS 119687]